MLLGAFLSLQATPCFNVQAIVKGVEMRSITVSLHRNLLTLYPNLILSLLQWELGSDHWTIKGEKRNCQ